MRVINVCYWCFAPPFPAAYSLVSVSVFKNPLLMFQRCEKDENASWLSIHLFLLKTESQCLYQKCSRYQRFAWFRCISCIYSWAAFSKKSSVSNCLGCSGKFVFSVIIFNCLMYSCPHSQHLQLCSLCSSVGSKHWGKSCWFDVGRNMSSPKEEFRIRLA